MAAQLRGCTTATGLRPLPGWAAFVAREPYLGNSPRDPIRTRRRSSLRAAPTRHTGLSGSSRVTVVKQTRLRGWEQRCLPPCSGHFPSVLQILAWVPLRRGATGQTPQGSPRRLLPAQLQGALTKAEPHPLPSALER